MNTQKLKINKGDRFGRLKILKELPRYRSPKRNVTARVFLCKCDCGNKCNVFLHSLRSGISKSCGCYCKEQTSKARKIHGMTGTHIYQIWKSMNQRCNNIKNKGYKNYGGRGIKVEWKSFEEFYKDMGKTYKHGLSIERINNNGNYCKNNCKWATYKEQANNNRRVKLYKYKNIKYNITDLAKLIGINRETLNYRLIHIGLPVEKAILKINFSTKNGKREIK